MTSGNIILEKLTENMACMRRHLLKEELSAALGTVTIEHRDLMKALKQSNVARNETMIRHLTDFQAQLHLVIAEVQERINCATQHLKTLENKKKLLRSYKVLALHPGQKAIIASGYSETARIREAQRLGAGEYLKKPYAIEKFGALVRKELDKQQHQPV
jgi:DNA-binding NtrC family response regulator